MIKNPFIFQLSQKFFTFGFVLVKNLLIAFITSLYGLFFL